MKVRLVNVFIQPPVCTTQPRSTAPPETVAGRTGVGVRPKLAQSRSLQKPETGGHSRHPGRCPSWGHTAWVLRGPVGTVGAVLQKAGRERELTGRGGDVTTQKKEARVPEGHRTAGVPPRLVPGPWGSPLPLQRGRSPSASPLCLGLL